MTEPSGAVYNPPRQPRASWTNPSLRDRITAIPEEVIMRKQIFAIALISLLVSIAAAQQPAGGRAPEPVAAARQLKPGFFLITGAGANTAVRVTPEGLIVVDTKNPSTETNNIFAGLNA